MNRKASQAANQRPPRPVPQISLDRIGGVAIDTNVYRNSGFRFRGQFKSALGTLKGLNIVLLVPEVWRRELESHTLDWMSGKLSEAKRILQMSDWARPSQVAAADDLNRLLAEENASSATRRLLDEHDSACRTVHLPTAWEAGARVLDDYFAARVPFEPTGDKKSEFPDAFALVTLERWCEKAGRQVIVVTEDQGCLAACDASPHLVGCENILAMLQALNEADKSQKRQASELHRVLVTELRSEVSQLRRDLDALIGTKIEAMDVELDADTEIEQFSYEVQDASLRTVHPGLGVHAPEVRVLSVGQHEVMFSWPFQVDVDISAHFYRVFGRNAWRVHWYGAPLETRSVTVDLDAIVTLQTSELLSAGTLPHAHVKSVDFARSVLEADFGVVRIAEPEIDD